MVDQPAIVHSEAITMLLANHMNLLAGLDKAVEIERKHNPDDGRMAVFIEKTTNTYFRDNDTELGLVLHDMLEILSQPDNENVTTLQEKSDKWFSDCFQRSIFVPGQEMDRANRFLEEALELYQAMGGDKQSVTTLTDYVYSRPVGERRQEIGGTIVTLSLLASTLGYRLVDCWRTAIRDGYTRIEKIRAKDKAKRSDTPLPGDIDSK